MIEGLEITTKVSLYKLMLKNKYDLILFSQPQDKTKVYHITINEFEIVTQTYLSIDAFRKYQWIYDGELDEHIEFIENDDPILKIIQSKYPNIQRVAKWNY